MTKLISLFCIFIISLSVLAEKEEVSFFDTESWKLIKEKQNIKIYAQPAKGSRLIGFKAEGPLNAPIEKVLQVLRNVEDTPKWAPNLKEKTTIREISDLEAITYNYNNLPWPVSDRDMVLINRLALDTKKKALIVYLHSVLDDSHPPKKKVVRAEIPYGTLLIYPQGQQQTFVRLTILIDPKGSIPIWLVNALQRKMPFQFLKALETHSRSVSGGPLRKGLARLLAELRSLL